MKTLYKTIHAEQTLINDLQKINRNFEEIFTEDLRLRIEASQLKSKAKDLEKKYQSLVSETKAKAKDASKKIQDLGLDEPAILSSIYDAFGEDIYKNITYQFK